MSTGSERNRIKTRKSAAGNARNASTTPFAVVLSSVLMALAIGATRNNVQTTAFQVSFLQPRQTHGAATAPPSPSKATDLFRRSVARRSFVRLDGMSSDDDLGDHDDQFHHDPSFLHNKLRTDISIFLTQRALQSFLFLLHQCRDPHTVRWLEDLYELGSFENYHGTGALNVTRYGTWDAILSDMLHRPKEIVVIAVKRRGRGQGGWSKNNPHLEDRYVEFEIDIDPPSLVSRIVSVRDQIAKEWVMDLETLVMANDMILESYHGKTKAGREQEQSQTDDIIEDSSAPFRVPVEEDSSQSTYDALDAALAAAAATAGTSDTTTADADEGDTVAAIVQGEEVIVSEEDSEKDKDIKDDIVNEDDGDAGKKDDNIQAGIVEEDIEDKVEEEDIQEDVANEDEVDDAQEDVVSEDNSNDVDDGQEDVINEDGSNDVDDGQENVVSEDDSQSDVEDVQEDVVSEDVSNDVDDVQEDVVSEDDSQGDVVDVQEDVVSEDDNQGDVDDVQEDVVSEDDSQDEVDKVQADTVSENDSQDDVDDVQEDVVSEDDGQDDVDDFQDDIVNEDDFDGDNELEDEEDDEDEEGTAMNVDQLTAPYSDSSDSSSDSSSGNLFEAASSFGGGDSSVSASGTSSTAEDKDKVVAFDRNAMYYLSNKLASNDRDSSVYRRGSFDLLILLATQESVHRVLREYREAGSEREVSYAWLSEFYTERIDSHFDGHQTVHGRADDFIEELLLTPPSMRDIDSFGRGVTEETGKVEDGKQQVGLIDPLRIAEDIIEMRSEVARDWKEVMEEVPGEHMALQRILLAVRMGNQNAEQGIGSQNNVEEEDVSSELSGKSGPSSSGAFLEEGGFE